MTEAAVGNRCLLFDLDGTLADTAPDLAGALNELRAEQGLEAIPLERLRPVVNGGAARIVEAGLPGGGEELRERYLELYGARVCRDTRLFPGVSDLLNALDARDLPWGIVTNKQSALTKPILESLGVAARAGCVVCGDTLAESKPHPAPVRHALELLGAEPGESWCLGDAERDVVATHGAGARAAIALWGYIAPDDDPAAWNAEARIEAPSGMLELLFPETGRSVTA